MKKKSTIKSKIRKVLLVSTCSRQLSEYEFVMPVAEIIKKSKVSFDLVNFKEEKINFESYTHVIICGNALRDNEFLKEGDFSWLSKIKIPILGICAGMQILCKENGVPLKESLSVGLKEVTPVFENSLLPHSVKAYFVHTKAPDLKKPSSKLKVIAKSGNEAVAIKVDGKSQYGILFHPEVRSQEIVLNFLQIK